MTRYSLAGAAYSSPATLGQIADYVADMALGVDGGCLATQGSEPAAPVDGAHLYARDGRVWTKRANGSVNLLNGAQAGISAPVTVGNTAATTPVGAYTVPGGEPAAGSVYQLRRWGIYSATGTPTLTIVASYGSYAVAAVPVITCAGTEASCKFDLTATLQFYGTVTAIGQVRLEFETAAATTVVLLGGSAAAGVTVVSSADLAFGITAAWSVQDAGNTLSALGGYGQRIA